MIKAVYIEWDDSHSYDGWEPINTIEKCCVPDIIISVGLIAKENETHISITSGLSFNDDGTVRACLGHLTIPKVAIKKRRNIKIPKKIRR